MASAVPTLMWEDHDGYTHDHKYALDFLHEPFGSNDRYFDLVYRGEFNLLIDGFDPDAHWLTHARVGFSFADDSGSDTYEYVDIFLDSEKIFDGIEVGGAHPQSNFQWWWKDVSGQLVVTLQSTGILSYEVHLLENVNDYYWSDTYQRMKLRDSSKREDVYLKEAHLKAWGHVRGVPDSGATIALFALGLGLIGVSMFAKKRVALAKVRG